MRGDYGREIVSVRLSAQEVGLVHALAGEWGCSRSEVVRRSVAWASRYGAEAFGQQLRLIEGDDPPRDLTSKCQTDDSAVKAEGRPLKGVDCR